MQAFLVTVGFWRCIWDYKPQDDTQMNLLQIYRTLLNSGLVKNKLLGYLTTLLLLKYSNWSRNARVHIIVLLEQISPCVHHLTNSVQTIRRYQISGLTDPSIYFLVEPNNHSHLTFPLNFSSVLYRAHMYVTC